MNRFTVGAAEVLRIEETMVHFDGREFFPELTQAMLAEHASWLAPFFDIEGFRMPCIFQSFVIRHGKLNVLIDTCLGNHKERPDFLLAHQLNNPYLERLAAAGLAPEDIDLVLCTHMHVDHVGWNTRLANGRWVPTFPNAKYVFSREEYARYAPENLIPGEPPLFFEVYQDSVLPVIESGQALMVTGEHVLNELMTVVPTPGPHARPYRFAPESRWRIGVLLRRCHPQPGADSGAGSQQLVLRGPCPGARQPPSRPRRGRRARLDTGAGPFRRAACRTRGAARRGLSFSAAGGMSRSAATHSFAATSS
jgi:hypothetical protein